MTATKRVFSGVQPTGQLHLGNYLGALKQWVRLLDTYDCFFCVVDLHALTIPEAIDPAALRAKCREVAGLYIAAGMDPSRCTIFVQSHVRQHSELCWLLNCVTPLGWLERMTQFKSKATGRETVGTGLLTYPVLQAADILLYDSELVPVGEDQKQHIELTRDVAQRFNVLFRTDTFVLPKPMIPPAGARVMGLDDPEQKMSKSLAEQSPKHAVGLLDSPKAIRKTIMSAKTDTGCEFRPEEASPGVRNLMGILEALTGETTAAIAQRFEGKGYGFLKQEVFDALIADLEPLQARYHSLAADPAELDRILGAAAERAEATAETTMKRVRSAMGVGI